MEEALKIIAAILGILGFALSCINLQRSLRTEQRARTLTIAQKKEELRTIVLQGKVAILNAKRRLQNVASDARWQGAPGLTKNAEEFSERYDAALKALQPFLQALGQDFRKTKYDQIINDLNDYIGKTNELVNPDLVEAEVEEYIDFAKKILERRKLLTAQGIDPGPG